MGADGGGRSIWAAERISEKASPGGEERQGRNTDRGDRQVAGGVKRTEIGGRPEQSKYGVVTNRGQHRTNRKAQGGQEAR